MQIRKIVIYLFFKYTHAILSPLGGSPVTHDKPQMNRGMRTFLWILLDIVLVNAAMIFAQFLRYSTGNLNHFYAFYFRLAPAMTVINIIVYALFGMYRIMWQYASAEDLIRLAFAALVGAISTFVFSLVANTFVKVNLFRLHRMIYLLFWLTSLLFVGASRLIYRYFVTREHFSLIRHSHKEMRRTMIIGAGWLGASVVHEMRRGNYGSRIPILVVDDNVSRAGSNLNGVPVRGGTGSILKLASDYSIDDIIIAVSTPQSDMNPVMEKCLATGCRVKRVKPIQDLDKNVHSAGKLRDINIGDLLSRPEEELNMTQVAAFVRDKTVLITGGGGSIGGELCRKLLPLEPKLLVLYDISENYMYDLMSQLQVEYRRNLDDRIVLCVGSILDEKRLDEVFGRYKPQVVLHAAAHKHVPLMEDCPEQAVKNNVFGTDLVARTAMNHGTERFVMISTDKAVNPTNIMGATKRLAEMVVEARNTQSDTVFTAVRFGNVLGSHGSVIPKFEQQIRAGGPVTLTHPDIIRYFMTIPEAASLVLQAASIAKGGEIFLLDMGRPVKIYDLAKRMIQLYAPENEDIEIVFTGLRKGEKLYEELLMANEDIIRTQNDKIAVAQPEVIEVEKLESILAELKDCIDQQGDMRACLHRLVPTFREPAQVNGAKAQIPAGGIRG